MANVTAINLGDNVVRLEVFLPENEYKQRAEKDITKYAQKAQVRGFRPGKMPKTLAKSMYGDSFTVESVNKLISEAVNKYITDNELDILAEPTPYNDQDAVVFGNKENKDITFAFCVALKEIISISDDDVKLVPRYTLKISDETIEEQVQKVLLKAGKVEVVETAGASFEKNDTFNVKISDETSGELITETIISPLDCSETFSTALEAAKIGDVLTATIIDLDKNGEADFVKKNILGITDETPVHLANSESLHLEIKSINRQTPAMLDDEFFTKINEGGKLNLHNESELRQFITKNISESNYFEENLLFTDRLIDVLVQQKTPQFPREFFKLRSLNAQREKNSEVAELDNVSIDNSIESYKPFFERMIMLNSLILHFEVQYPNSEVYATFLKIFNASMGLPPDFEFSEYHRKIYEEAKKNNTSDYSNYVEITQKNKLAQFLFDENKTENVLVTPEEFREHYQAYYKRDEPDSGAENFENELEEQNEAHDHTHETHEEFTEHTEIESNPLG